MLRDCYIEHILFRLTSYIRPPPTQSILLLAIHTTILHSYMLLKSMVIFLCATSGVLNFF